MISASEELMTTLQESHVVATKAVVMNGNDPIMELDIVDGNVTIDSAAKNRRTANVKLSDPTGNLVPKEITDALHPLAGNEVWLYRGAFVPAFDDTEMCQMGCFAIKDGEIVDSGSDLAITLKLVDRSFVVSRRRVKEPIVYTSGPALCFALYANFYNYYPEVKYANNFLDVRPWIIAPNTKIDRGADIWDTSVKWALDAGLDLYFNNMGELVLEPLPAANPVAEEVVWQFEEGEASTLLSTRKDLTVDDTYNHVICYGQASDGTPPVWGEAMVTDTRHPLSIYSHMGDVPFFYSSPMFTTPEQCTVVAQSLLYKHLGHTEHIHFNALVNPCLDDGDLVTVARERTAISDYFTLDKLTIPMTAMRAMECDTRERFILDSV